MTHPAAPGDEPAPLEAQRHRMVQAVLRIRARYEHSDTMAPGSAEADRTRTLLRAAVEDLEWLDERLFQARQQHRQPAHRARHTQSAPVSRGSEPPV